MCHAYLSLNTQPKGFRTHSWVGRYQPLVWEQSDWQQEVALPYCFPWIGESLTIFKISLQQAEWIPVPLTTCQVHKEKGEDFHSPTEGMAATFVNTASIPVCLCKKALRSATDPKDTISSKAFLHLSGCIPSWKRQESKANVFIFNNWTLQEG